MYTPTKGFLFGVNPCACACISHTCIHLPAFGTPSPPGTLDDILLAWGGIDSCLFWKCNSDVDSDDQ